MKTPGVLYLCPTPIGNLEDITLRAIHTLQAVDLIAAEDTRHSAILLKHYGIATPMVSYHQHNERERGEELIRRLKEGQSIAIISDAGMPGISDPGALIIPRLQEEGLPYTVLPGANAGLTALVASGLPTGLFQFIGFLPDKKKDRESLLDRLSGYPGSSIFYEAPHRIRASLQDLEARWPERDLALGRELTKHYEEIERGTVTSLRQRYEEKQPRGEYVLILGPDTTDPKEAVDIKSLLQDLIDEGHRKSEAVAIVAKAYQLPKNQVYRESLDL